MPKVKRSRKAPPDGWELIEPTLDELDQKMREGEWRSSCLGGPCPRVSGLDAPRRQAQMQLHMGSDRQYHCGLLTLMGFVCVLTHKSTRNARTSYNTHRKPSKMFWGQFKRKVESLLPIFRIHHQKTRYIFDLFYKRKAISRELYEYCIKEGYADKNLIAKWKKQGYENLCCLRCIQTRDTNFGTNCICRVPKSKLEVGRIIECTHCGCRGCSG
uniref:Protein BUD31 homolog n=1 Tax=Camelus bactrianus TaxID=9837 RepID=A0A9W3FGG4_CAMBA|nr:protein BUD31 homolog [Camelus bactrianus]